MPAEPAETPVNGESWRRISPLAVIDFVVTAIRQGLVQLLPALAVAFASAASSERFEVAWVLAGLAALLLLGLVWSVLSWMRFGYRLQAARIVVRKGVLLRQALNVEFDRIQNVSVNEPFYFRPFGLAALGIDTAGSSGKEIRLPGLPLAQARALRDRLVAEAQAAGDAPGGETGADEPAPGEEHGGTVLLRLSRRDVVYAGLTANFMLWAAVAIGTVMGSGDTAENLVGWLVQTLDLGQLADSLREQGGDLMVALAVAAAALLALMLLPLVSVIGALLRYDGYTLSVDGDRFRRSSGLLSRHDESVRQHKIQGVTWKQNAIALLLGRINLQLRQASSGSGIESGQQPGTGLAQAFMVPSLLPVQAQSLTARFLPGCDTAAARYTRVDPWRFIGVSSAWIAVPPALGLMPLAVIVDARFALAWLVVAAVIVLIAARCWRQTGWAISGDHGLVRKGFIGSNTSVFPLFKVQRVDVVQTPWLEKRGLAHLTLHLASHSVSLHWMRLEDAEQIRDLALYRAECGDEAWI